MSQQAKSKQIYLGIPQVLGQIRTDDKEQLTPGHLELRDKQAKWYEQSHSQTILLIGKVSADAVNPF